MGGKICGSVPLLPTVRCALPFSSHNRLTCCAPNADDRPEKYPDEMKTVTELAAA